MTTLFFDTETTGKAEFRLPPTHPFQPRIVQLGAILCDADRRVVAELNLLVKPNGWTVPDETAEIHGITTERAEAFGIRIDTVMGLFASLCSRAELLVAHNIDFDVLMVLVEFGRIPTDSFEAFRAKRQFCTMKATTPLCKLPGKYRDYKWPKLQEAHQHLFGREFDGAHDAMADVRACRDVYYALHPLATMALGQKGDSL